MKRRILFLILALVAILASMAQIDVAQATGECSCCFCRSLTEYCCDMYFPASGGCEPVCEWVLWCPSAPSMCGGQ